MSGTEIKFEVELHPRAKKELRSLDSKTYLAVKGALLEMEIDPFEGDQRKLQGSNLYRRRVGRYRIVFDVDTAVHLVFVHRIRHRKDAYKGL
jgi:mRNA interferase RelE/StbE